MKARISVIIALAILKCSFGMISKRITTAAAPTISTIRRVPPYAAIQAAVDAATPGTQSLFQTGCTMGTSLSTRMQNMKYEIEE